MNTRLAASTALTAALLATAHSAKADTLLSDFTDFNLTGTYASWLLPSANITSGPDDYTVEAIGFGGGFFDISPNIDATGETTLELDVTINAADPIAGLGVLAILVDEDITQQNYGQPAGEFTGWFGLLPGESYTLSVSVDDFFTVSNPGATSGLDLSDLSFFHLQIDSGGSFLPYSVTFDEIRLVGGVVTEFPGDANGDLVVDLIDLSILATNFGTTGTATFADGDFNGDTAVDLIDLSILATNFGATAPVPEPTAATLLGLGIATLAARRRKA
ncbi:PEP-CTERM sorting domain-containing protein [Mucisphaera sp.]|uniref:PEP-CTERM sorting domain-containing protein n=1 Tax=Mucisphaera sp. TaxID=2913024 RepID=UPI003D12CD3D